MRLLRAAVSRLVGRGKLLGTEGIREGVYRIAQIHDFKDVYAMDGDGEVEEDYSEQSNHCMFETRDRDDRHRGLD